MESQLDELIKQIEQAIKRLGIEVLETEAAQMQSEMASSDFWKNREKAADISQKNAKLAERISPWRELQKKLADISEMTKLGDSSLDKELSAQLAAATKDFESLKAELKFSGPYDDHDAILAVHAGTGGTDAMDWAQMLERMYLRFAESQKFKTEIIEEQVGDEAGIKHATLRIAGNFAYGRLKGEHGVHRLVRLSPFNSDNLRQTSFALIEVLPEIDDPEVDIDESDLKIDVYRAGGKGGQSVNTTDSAVRITHLPTGITVSIQNERSQLQNKQTAMKILRSKLIKLSLEQHKEKISDLKGPDTQAAWGNQIRNYVLHPYTLVKDARSGFETKNAQAILDGDLTGLVDAYLDTQPA